MGLERRMLPRRRANLLETAALLRRPARRARPPGRARRARALPARAGDARSGRPLVAPRSPERRRKRGGSAQLFLGGGAGLDVSRNHSVLHGHFVADLGAPFVQAAFLNSQVFVALLLAVDLSP